MPTGSPLRIGIDARCLNTLHLRGMGRYVIELITHINQLATVEWRFFADRPDTIFHKPWEIDGKVDLFDVKGYRFHAWEQIGLPWRTRQAGLDLLHCTATTLPYWQPMPTVVTIHDTLPWQEEPAGTFERWYLHKLMPAALAKCTAIITISESSRADIVGLWPGLAEKVHVIPHGINDTYLGTSEHSMSADLAEQIGPHPYFLYVGGALPRKRFSWALNVVQGLGPSPVTLVACGFADGERADVMSSLPPETRQRVTFLPFVQEADMPALYGHALAVLYPTLYEGFGFPALEAQAVGTPVLFSALGSLKELEGPLSRVLPPDDLRAWVDTCKAIVDRPTPEWTAVDAARVWARQFSWSVSARRHMEIYRESAAANRRSGHTRAPKS